MNQYNGLLLVLLTVSGALLGTLITLIVQVAIGVLHRKNERAIKTFDTRLKLYVDFCIIHQEIGCWRTDLMELEAAKKKLSTSREEVVKKVRCISNQLKNNQSPENMTIELDRMDADLEECHANLARCDADLDKLSDKLDSMSKVLRELSARLLGASAAIDLVASRQVRQLIKMLHEEIKTEKNPMYAMDRLAPLIQAARRDLKIVD